MFSGAKYARIFAPRWQGIYKYTSMYIDTLLNKRKSNLEQTKVECDWVGQEHKYKEFMRHFIWVILQMNSIFVKMFSFRPL